MRNGAGIWTCPADRSYTACILYKYANDRAQSHSVNINGSTEEVDKFSYYYELPHMNEHTVETGAKTFRTFREGRYTLRSLLSLKAVNSRRVNTWIVFKTDPGEGGTAIKAAFRRFFVFFNEVDYLYGIIAKNNF